MLRYSDAETARPSSERTVLCGKRNAWLLAVVLLFPLACRQQGRETVIDPAASEWQVVLAQAEGTRVHMLMWMGDPDINRYMNSYVVPEVRDRFDIELTLGSGQGNQLVSLLMTEIEAGAGQSGADMVWINGETFYQLRQLKALYGPFARALPNSSNVNWDDPFIAYDFQEKG